MVQYGFTPLQAMQTATINGVDLLGQPLLGEIKVGNNADSIAVAVDPIQKNKTFGKCEMGNDGCCYL